MLEKYYKNNYNPWNKKVEEIFEKLKTSPQIGLDEKNLKARKFIESFRKLKIVAVHVILNKKKLSR